LVAPNWDLSTLLVAVVVEGKGMLLDWEGEEGGMGEPVYVFGRGGGGGGGDDDVAVVVDDDTLFNKEVAEEAKLHKVEEAVDEEAKDDEEEKEVLDGIIDPSLLKVVNGSTGL